MNRGKGFGQARPRRATTVRFIQCAAIASLLLPALPAAAANPPVQSIIVPLIEWDLPAIMDAQPGAMVVDSQGHDKNRVWFVTRLGAPQRVFRFEPNKSLMKGWARWTSWELSETGLVNGIPTPGFAPGFSGGLKKLRPSYDRRFVFVRTQNQLQRIDTQDCDNGSPQTCKRTVWLDQAPEVISVSDVGIDDQNNVYTATSPNGVPADSYIQKLVPESGAAGNYTVKRWTVGGGAGLCVQGSTLPCLSGIAVDPGNRYLVYYSETSDNNIGVLDVYHNTVRRWSLNTLGGVSEPRQLHIDKSGKVWVVTGSGHLVSLNPCTNKMTKHEIPAGSLNDPFGVAPDDDVVGYTASDLTLNKVGMVHPIFITVPVTPTPPVPVPTSTPCVPAVCERAVVASNWVCPQRKLVHGEVTSKVDGIFVEAFIGGPNSMGTPLNPAPGNDSLMPLGITPAKAKSEGTFFYAVGQKEGDATVDRIGFVRLQPRAKMKHGRDDDDVDDGWDDGKNHDGPDGHHGHPHHWHDGDANDGDDDGFDNDYDTPSRENVQVVDDAPALGGGQFVEFPVTTSATSLALIAMSTADDPLAQIGVEIYDPLGLLVATSAPTPGIAVAPPVLLPSVGNYRVRIRNYGVLPITHTPKLIVREPWD